MSLADYAMQRTALTEIHRAAKKIRQITSWYAKVMRTAKDEITQATQMKRTMKQQLQTSIFTYANQQQAAMNQALADNDNETFKLLQQDLTNKQTQATAYLSQYEAQVDEMIKVKQDAYDELEADKTAELESAKADKEYWEGVHKQAQQNYSQGVKNMWSNG